MRAGDAEPLLLAEREHAVPMRLLVEPLGQRAASPTAAIASASSSAREGAGLGRIGDRGRERADREIGPLRQRHQLGVLGHGDGAGAERPSARNGAEQGRLARARTGR